MRIIAALLMVLAVGLVAGHAHAHPFLSPEQAPDAVQSMAITEAVAASPAAAPTDSLALWSLVVVAALLALRRRIPARSLAVALVLFLAVLAFETALHSAHHLGEARPGATCAIAAGSTHLSGATPALPQVDAIVLAPTERVVSAEPALLVTALPLPHQGRAPPSLV